MALQDLTPQLRTRLNRMERIVGWFVFFAAMLLLSGFGYYIYHTAEHKGWFKIKAPFLTYVQSSAGLNVGDPVVMMGFAVGTITSVEPQKPYEPHNVKVEFEILDPYFRYLWTGGSYLKVNSADFLGKRQLEVTRGTNGYALVVTQPVSIHTLDEAKNLMASAPGHWQLAQDIFSVNSNLLFHAYDHLEYVFDETNSSLLATAVLESNSIYIFDNADHRKRRIMASWDGRFHHYKIFKQGDDTAWLRAVETPPISDQLQAMVTQVQNALPGILSLTNKISTVLDNAANATSNLNSTLVVAQPMLTNFAIISGQLRQPGAPMVWALGTNGNEQVQGALTNVDALLTHLADITGNLNMQVQANTNMLGSITKIVVDTDDFVQGLKRHWLLRSAFKVKPTNAPPTTALPPKMR
jgi:hypothetical protein